MAKTERQELLSKRAPWFILIGLVLLVIFLGAAFSRAWQTNQSLRDELAELQPMVTAVLQAQSTLEAQLVYVQSDEYVEGWAKTRAKMALPGETLLVAVRATATPVPVATPAAPEIELPTPVAASTAKPQPFGWLQRLFGGD